MCFCVTCPCCQRGDVDALCVRRDCSDHVGAPPACQERKRVLTEDADCIIALPGGMGTWDELWEAACLKGIGERGRCILVFFLSTSCQVIFNRRRHILGLSFFILFVVFCLEAFYLNLVSLPLACQNICYAMFCVCRCCCCRYLAGGCWYVLDGVGDLLTSGGVLFSIKA